MTEQDTKANTGKAPNKVITALKSSAIFSIIWLIFMLFYRVVELIFYGYSHALPQGAFKLLTISWFIDLQFWLKCLLPFTIVFVLIFLLSKGAARIIASVFVILYFCINLLLINYFNESLVTLGADLFGYSYADISQTVGASGSVSFLSVLLFFILIAPLVVAQIFVPKRLKMNRYLAIFLPVISLILISFNFGDSNNSGLDSDFAANIVTNKSEFFYTAVDDYFFKPEYEVDIYADSYLADIDAGESFIYVDKAYPFLRHADTVDVLSPFFQPQEKAPNIVIILVEGLGRAFTNKDAYLGSFTPFLDSLSTKSLYWKNFLSDGGRTFAVLPSLMGSLPFGKNGYLAMGDNMPDQLSLYNLLKKNGYNTSFYYGGDSGFDNMKLYLKKNNVDEINDEGTFPAKYEKLPEHNGFTWGYGDKEVFDYYFEKRNLDKSVNPYLSVILTVATHSPFLIKEEDKYNKKFEERLSEINLSTAEKAERENYKKQYSTILYADDALKDFFTKYEKRPDFENTIFVITGDHRIPEIPLSTKIDRYHVPLIIYSPLLKRTKEMAAISSHFDVTPSLINYLKSNFLIKTPELESWMGEGLDTTKTFQNINKIPLMQTKTSLIDFVMGEYHLNADNLFRLDENMNETPIGDKAKKEQLISAFNAYKLKNNEITNGSKIIPDSLYSHYGSSK
ncbi:MAG: LTA synthase family protein [Leeuwenhoekiella sp.]